MAILTCPRCCGSCKQGNGKVCDFCGGQGKIRVDDKEIKDAMEGV